jgi:hypothetical protein
MTYTFRKGALYRMPTHFGPSLGPRQGPDGSRYDGPVQEAITYSVRFRTDRAALEALLPEGFVLAGDPIVSINATYMTGIEWLAGRGYNYLGVEVPAEFAGQEDHVRGPFQLVIWENLADPIITGREDVGFAKIYAELPPPRIRPNLVHCAAAWLGFTFMDMRITDLAEDTAPLPAPSDGTLHLKYFPKTGSDDEADVCYPVLMTHAANNQDVTTLDRRKGEGTVTFHKADWEDLPTFFPIVNALAALPVKEFAGASKVTRRGTSPVFYRQAGTNPARILR